MMNGIFTSRVEEFAKYICDSGKADILEFDTSKGFNLLNTLNPGSPEGDITAVGQIIGEAVSQELSLYRNKLKPVLHKYIDSVKSKLGHKVSKADRYEIEEVDIPRLVQDANELGLFNNPLTNDALFNNDLYPQQVPVVDIKDMLLAENELNSYVTEMITEADKENPAKYFEMMSYFEVNPLKNVVELQDTCKAWLIAKYVKEQKLPELGIAEAKMVNVIDALATRIHIAITTIENYIKFEKLYLDSKVCPVTGKTVVKIFKPVYDSCVNEIGLVDAIYGLAIKEPASVNFEDTFKAAILARKEELIKIWDSYLVSSRYVDPVQEQERFRIAFKTSLREVTDELDDELKSLHSGSLDFSDLDNEVTKLLSVGKLTDEDEFIEKMCVAIIAKYLFNKTNYFKFFTNVEKFLTRDDKLKVDDVIPLVLAVLVVDYLMGQMKPM